jgi:hypothetical protein
VRVGILIIGSLLWEDKYCRPVWIRDRLSKDGAVDVRVPIRYGRTSQTWDNCYTMVFSSSAGDGQAKILPCLQDDPGQLVAEAEALWAAESGARDSISSDWGGCVVLCVNPDRQIPDSVLNAWTQRVRRESEVYAEFPKSQDDDVNLVTADGRLLIWPERVDCNKLDFDVLLATANYPRPLSYPHPDAIANAWNKAKKEPRAVRYFRQNRANGIFTFQDQAIIQLLENS